MTVHEFEHYIWHTIMYCPFGILTLMIFIKYCLAIHVDTLFCTPLSGSETHVDHHGRTYVMDHRTRTIAFDGQRRRTQHGTTTTSDLDARRQMLDRRWGTCAWTLIQTDTIYWPVIQWYQLEKQLNILEFDPTLAGSYMYKFPVTIDCLRIQSDACTVASATCS